MIRAFFVNKKTLLLLYDYCGKKVLINQSINL